MRSSLSNGFSRIARTLAPRDRHLYYIAPGTNWSVDWDAFYITRGVRKHGLKAKVVKSPAKLSDEIVHFGSLWESVASLDGKVLSRNKAVATVFHGEKSDAKFTTAIRRLAEQQNRFARIHTSSAIMEERLKEFGFESGKLVRIPLGVDLEAFRPVMADVKVAIRRSLGIPDDAVCIGSFQKDGEGWGEGLSPKFVKGPDIFLQVVEKVGARRNVFVLLSAPARGYVKKGLDSLGIPYQHVIESDYQNIPRLFNAIDIYLLTSREEGGPKGPLEAMASGVPVVSSRVGLAPELISSGVNGLLGESENVDQLAEHLDSLVVSEPLREKYAKNGLVKILSYDWQAIADRYFYEIYQPMLRN